jgi:hypothetical protein
VQNVDNYEMPKPPIGAVHFYPAIGDTPVPALVTQVGRRAVNLLAFPPDTRGGVPRDGVRHIDDPDLRRTTETAMLGCWDFTDEHKLLVSQQRTLEQLAEAVGFVPGK